MIDLVKAAVRVEILNRLDTLIKNEEIKQKEQSKDFVSGYCNAIKDVINIIKEVL